VTTLSSVLVASRIVIECLQSEHKPLEPRVNEELLGWTAKTFARAPELAGLDINSFQITNLDPLNSIRSLRGLTAAEISSPASIP